MFPLASELSFAPVGRQGLHISDIEHGNKVTQTSAHDEEVEDLMGTEVGVPVIEEREFQCVDHTADGVDDASCKQP